MALLSDDSCSDCSVMRAWIRASSVPPFCRFLFLLSFDFRICFWFFPSFFFFQTLLSVVVVFCWSVLTDYVTWTLSPNPSHISLSEQPTLRPEGTAGFLLLDTLSFPTLDFPQGWTSTCSNVKTFWRPCSSWAFAVTVLVTPLKPYLFSLASISARMISGSLV